MGQAAIVILTGREPVFPAGFDGHIMTRGQEWSPGAEQFDYPALAEVTAGLGNAAAELAGGH